MLQLLSEIRAVMVNKKISFQKLGELIHKDAATVARQLDASKSNPTLASIMQIVDAIGARLVVQTEESVMAIQEADLHIYRQQIADMSLEISRLRDMVADKDARIARRDAILEDQHHELMRLREAVDHKDAALDRLVERQEELYKKLLEK